MQWPFTRTNDDEMTTNATMITKTKTPRWKWSEDDIEPQYYCHDDDDEDTATLTVGEQRRIQGYHANAQRNWRNADEDNDDKKSNISEFGLCCTCKKKLNDRAHFVCHPQKSFYRLCTKCHEDQTRACGGGGCN